MRRYEFVAEYKDRVIDFEAESSEAAVDHARHVESDPGMKTGKLLKVLRYYPSEGRYSEVNLKRWE